MLLEPFRCLHSDPGKGEEFLDLRARKQIALPTEFATHFGLSVGQGRPGFFTAQRLQHDGHPFARAGAGKAQGTFGKDGRLFLVEKAVQELAAGDRKQFIGLQGVEQSASPVPAITVTLSAPMISSPTRICVFSGWNSRLAFL